MANNRTSAINAEGRLQHIAFIMDGNGRWARRRGLPREAGHKVGAKAFVRVVEICGELGIDTVTVYAFSTENWKRPPAEVKAIMGLLSDYLDQCIKDMDKYEVRYHFIGDRSVFDKDFVHKMNRVEELSHHKRYVLNIALNYGARAEIVHAVNGLLEEGSAPITEETFAGRLYTAHSPDPDLIVRTGGDMRLSNFLLWQAAYAELYFTDVLWPDIDKADIEAALADYATRKRRFGGV